MIKQRAIFTAFCLATLDLIDASPGHGKAIMNNSVHTRFAEVIYPQNKVKCVVNTQNGMAAINLAIASFKSSAEPLSNDKIPRPILIVTLVNHDDRTTYSFYQTTFLEFKDNHVKMVYEGGEGHGFMRDIEPIMKIAGAGHCPARKSRWHA